MKKGESLKNSQTTAGGLNRRDFLEFMGMGLGGAMLAGSSAWAVGKTSHDELPPSQETAARARRYFSDQHTDARMHLGGIGTGNFEIGADGQLTTWQLFNTLRDGQIPFYFGVKAGDTTRLLQTAGGPDWPRIKKIEMQGEYPIATLMFRDEDLPVKVELDAFTPFAPLDADLSSKPVAIFRFRLRNPTLQPQTISLAAMLANPVGYAAIGEIQGCVHPCFGANINEPIQEGGAKGLFLRALGGKEPTLDRPVEIHLLKDLFIVPPDPRVGDKNEAYVAPSEIAIPPLDRPENLKISIIDEQHFSASKLTASNQHLIWLDEAPVGLTAGVLQEMKQAVEAGAVLLFSGSNLPLLSAYASTTSGRKYDESLIRPDIVFEDFEQGYGNWTVEGDAFGNEPADGTLPGQQPVSGFLGKGLVNSFRNGDDATGKMTSRALVIQRKFIRFLIGGGHYETTQLRLIIDGKIVRASSGEDNERLKPAAWNVEEFVGRTAHIEIVDQQKGGWGHINIDQIVFTDWPGDRDALPLLDELLPVRFSGIEKTTALDSEPVRLILHDLSLNPKCEHGQAKTGLEQFSQTLGKGKVVLLAGQLFNPALTYSAPVRQKTYAQLCALVGARYIVTAGQSMKEPGYGSLALTVLADDVTGLTHGDEWSEVWSQFSSQGRFQPWDSLKSNRPTPSGRTTHCALATTVSVPAGGVMEVPFVLTWHYPNKYSEAQKWMGCYYATQWPNAHAVMREAVANYALWCQRTESFRQTFYDSTLPYWLLDCVTANLAICRHVGVVFRIANGDIYGWEGSNGSCQPTCTHVWGYEQSLAHLFPDLEKEMRRIDYFHQQNPDGGINNRTEVPSPLHPTGERPFTDGHASCILKAYREALNTPDESFFQKYWQPVKRAVEYLIHRDAQANGGQAGGILQDEQWNTYDEALHGVTTFLSGYYLAALRAGEEWARRRGDAATAERFHGIFLAGQQKLVELCWNGEYFEQHLPDYQEGAGEVGPGCMSDQLLGQWWAHQLGLGYILPKDKVVLALRSIFKNNWKSDLHGWNQNPRQFAGPADQGLIVCTWPKGGRPERVMNYSDELWTGIEYQVAAHMIYEGMVDEGFTIVKAARDRYDGAPRPPMGRNPWCEIECGGHYTRAMSSWSLLLALSGFEYDGPASILRFQPQDGQGNFRCFFSAAEGWGRLAQITQAGKQTINISVAEGRLPIKILRWGIKLGTNPTVAAAMGGKGLPLNYSTADSLVEIKFPDGPIVLQRGQELEIIFS